MQHGRCARCRAHIEVPADIGLHRVICRQCGQGHVSRVAVERYAAALDRVSVRALASVELRDSAEECNALIARFTAPSGKSLPFLPEHGRRGVFEFLKRCCGHLPADVRTLLMTRREVLDAERARRREDWALLCRSGGEAGLKLLGDAFERYVGRWFARQGYEVEYPGLAQRDGGIDLVCTNRHEVLLIQCKYYSKERLVDLATIQGFRSAAAFYSPREQSKDTVPALVTTSRLTFSARRFAKEHGMLLYENVNFRQDPTLW